MISISIIVPVYKVEIYVSKCIRSIIEQENCGASLECIIVDDGSPDNSMTEIHSIVNQYKGNINFIFLKHDNNKGLSAARNTGIDVAHGDYIMFVDSDDWLPTNSILKFVEILQNNPHVDLVIGNRISTKEGCRLQNIIKEVTLLNNYQIRKFLLNYQVITCSAWNKVIKNRIVKNNKFHEGIIFEDTPWAYFLFKDINTVLITPVVTYIYENIHPCSIVNTAKNKDNTSLHTRSVFYICNAILDAPYKDLFADSLFYVMKYFIVAFRLQYEHHLEKKECRLLKQVRKRFFLTSLNNGRLFLAFFIFTLTYPPTSYMFNFGWIRRHYNNIEKTGRIISNFLERFH